MFSPRTLLTGFRQARCLRAPFTAKPAQRIESWRFMATATSGSHANTIWDAVRADHKELERWYNNIVNSKTEDEITKWQNQFVWELARHGIAEEITVYPVIEKRITDGVEIVKKRRAQHQEIKEKLYKFQSLHIHHEEFEETIRSLWGTLSGHIAEEDSTELPALQKELSDEESKALVKSYDRTKFFVPTRSHPSAPRVPPYETAAGLLAAPIDKLRDLFSSFPAEEEK